MPSGLGWLDSTLGVGAIFGGFLAIGLAARHRLASDFGWGVVFWALPLLLISVWPTAVAAFIAMAIIGAANPVVDINAYTILQRLTPDAVLGTRVRGPGERSDRHDGARRARDAGAHRRPRPALGVSSSSRCRSS